ncbi:MAG: hypothetical protein LBQ50_04500 [Planctomycetaceae bacterium]|nr:hypothetical protein [Planctomycetaceae bacterium]
MSKNFPLDVVAGNRDNPVFDFLTVSTVQAKYENDSSLYHLGTPCHIFPCVYRNDNVADYWRSC